MILAAALLVQHHAFIICAEDEVRRVMTESFVAFSACLHPLLPRLIIHVQLLQIEEVPCHVRLHQKPVVIQLVGGTRVVEQGEVGAEVDLDRHGSRVEEAEALCAAKLLLGLLVADATCQSHTMANSHRNLGVQPDLLNSLVQQLDVGGGFGLLGKRAAGGGKAGGW